MTPERRAELEQQLTFRLGITPAELDELLWPYREAAIEREWEQNEKRLGDEAAIEKERNS